MSGGKDTLTVVRFGYPAPDGLEPVRLVSLQDGPWINAHDLARVLGYGRAHQRLTFRGGGRNRATAIARSRLGEETGGPPLREGLRSPVWFVSEDVTFEFLYTPGAGTEALPLRQWLMREALPTFRTLELPHTIKADLPVDLRSQRGPGSRARVAMKPTSLYRLYGADDTLLYVGISMTLARRVAQHQRGQSWWRQVSEIKHERFLNRARALAAEAEAIRTENPRYNINGRSA